MAVSGVSGTGPPKLQPVVETKRPAGADPAGAPAPTEQTGEQGWLSNAADKAWAFTKDVARGKYGMAGMSEEDKARGQKKMEEMLEGGGNLMNPFSVGLSIVNNGKKLTAAMQSGDGKASMASAGLLLVDVGTGGKGGKVMKAAKPLMNLAAPVTNFLESRASGMVDAMARLAQSPSAQAFQDFAAKHLGQMKELMNSASTPDAVKQALAAVADFSKKFHEGAGVLAGLRSNPSLKAYGDDLAHKITSGRPLSSGDLTATLSAVDQEIAKASGPARQSLEELKTRVTAMKADVQKLEAANEAAGSTVGKLRSEARTGDAVDLAGKQTLGMGTDALKTHATDLKTAMARIDDALKALPAPEEGVANFAAAAGQVSTLRTQLESAKSKLTEKLGVVDQQVAGLERKAAGQAEAAAAGQAAQAQRAAEDASKAAAAKATAAAVDAAKAQIAPATRKLATTAENEGGRMASSFRGLDDAKNQARVLNAEAAVERDFAAVASAIEKASANAGPEVKAALQEELKRAQAARANFHSKAASERHELGMPRTEASGPVAKPVPKSTAEPIAKQYLTPQSAGRAEIVGNGPKLNSRAMIEDAARGIPSNLDVGSKLKLLLERIENTSGLTIGERASLVEAARAKFF